MSSNDVLLSYHLGNFFGAILWGGHTAFICLLLHLVGRKRALNSRIIVASLIGYLLNTAAIGLVLYDASQAVTLGYEVWTSTNKYVRVLSFENFVYYLALAVSDCVQLWRTTVICRPPRYVLYPLFFLLIVSILAGFADDVTAFVSLFQSYSRTSSQTATIARVAAALDLAWLLPSILLNATTTLMIFLHIQRHTQDVKQIPHPGTTRLDYYQRLSALMIETGVVFTVAEALFLINNLVCEYGPILTGPAYGMLIAIRPIVSIIAGAYPLSVTLYAHLAKSVTRTYTSEFAFDSFGPSSGTGEGQEAHQSAQIGGSQAYKTAVRGTLDRSQSNLWSDTESALTHGDLLTPVEKDSDSSHVVLDSLV